jgi:hypothetical protein
MKRLNRGQIRNGDHEIGSRRWWLWSSARG